MKKAGYTTAIIGKWHLGYEPKFRPDKQGFDYSIGPIGYGGDYFYHVEQNPIDVEGLTGAHNLAQNGKEIFRNGEYMTKLIGKEATKWLDRQEDEKPFFLYLPFTSPHDPFQGPNDDKGRSLQGNEWDFGSREKYVEMVETMDEEIGEVLNVLDSKDFKRETIVIFFSDNGGTKMANNGQFSGYKGSVYEGGIRVPCIIRWPGKVKANTTSGQTTISFDLSYSVLHAAGVPTDSLQLDGYDILSHVVDGKADFDRILYWRRKRAENVRKAVRDGHLKYLAEYEKGELVDEKLFDLEKDPSEENDLLKTLPEKVTVLKQELSQWERDVEAPRLKDFNR
jgi:N-acetylgalactosamine-6-sulfatase